MVKWTFITNHAAVLSLISLRSMITASELALKIGISERAIRRIISELHNAGYIQKEKDGRRVRYQVRHSAPLRHKITSNKPVGELLKILNAS